MIQWTHVKGQSSPVEYIPILKRIQQAGKAILVRVNHIQDIEPLMKELSSRGLYIYVEPTLSSRQQAKEVVKWVEKWTHD
ncbi:hypothetical protein GF406_16145 [candidate division KSB1 bacterium]|nr:hypothetical protein [candidate division KSB1 bacterium]